MRYLSALMMLFLSLMLKAQTLKPLQQRVFIHTASDTLKQGETLQFKGYVSDSASDQVLYVDLVSLMFQSVVKRKVLYLKDGEAIADFFLGLNLEPGNYILRGYTKSIATFDDSSAFEKAVHLLPSYGTSWNNEISKPSDSILTKSNHSLTFYPEGGSWIANRLTRFAVRVNSGPNQQLAVEGNIFSRSGKSLGRFSTDSLGIGNFSLSSDSEGCYAILQNGNNNQRFPLPLFSKWGVALRVRNHSDSLKIDVLQNTLEKSHRSPYLLLGSYRGGFFRRVVVPVGSDSTWLTVPPNFLAGELLSFELYQGSELLSRRLYLANSKDGSDELPYIQGNKNIHREGDSVAFIIRGKPGSHLSLSAGGARSRYSDMKAYFNLISWADHDKEFLSNYLKLPQPDIDALMLTLSVNKFGPALGDSSSFSYAPEKGMIISGKVLKGGKPLIGANVSLFLSASKNSLLRATKADSLGRFSFDSLVFFGRAQAKLVCMKSDGEKIGRILLDSTFTTLPIPTLPYDTASKFVVKNLPSRKEVEEEAHLREALSGHLLKEVVIKKSRSIILQSGAFIAMHKEQAFTLGKADLEYKTLSWWLLNRVKGAHQPLGPDFDGSETGVVFNCDDFVISEYDGLIVPKRRLIFPQFVVNGKDYTSEEEDVSKPIREEMFDLPLDRIKTLRVQRLTGTLTAVPGIIVERVVIYLTVKDVADDWGSLLAEVNGFDNSLPDSLKVETSRQESKLSHAYWNPNIVIDRTGEAVIRFPNPVSRPTSLTYELHGYSSGRPISKIGQYRVSD